MGKLLHNCRIKRYPDGSLDIIVASNPFGGGTIDREPQRYDYPELYAAEEEAVLCAASPVYAAERAEAAYADLERAAIEDGDDFIAPEQLAAAKAAANKDRARRRAAAAVRDLGLCNDWAWFVTLTLSPERINRYDPVEVIRHLNHWLDNNVRRKGLAYVLVPEHHKDGAIHFHGFFNGALEAVPSGHRDRAGHPVYNLPGWGWGFSTAIALYGERRAAVAYVCKYIGKQGDKIGGRWYYSGGKLRRPEIEWRDEDFATMLQNPEAKPFEIEALPRTRFVRLLQAAKQDCSAAQKGPSACSSEGQFTNFGLSRRTSAPCAARDSAPEGGGMTPEKAGGKEGQNDHRIPVKPGDGTRFGGSDDAKRAHHADGFTYRAPHFGRVGAADGTAQTVHVGSGKKDGQAAPLRPARAAAGGNPPTGRGRVGFPRHKAGNSQDPPSGVGGC